MIKFWIIYHIYMKIEKIDAKNVVFMGIGEPEDEVICACAQRRSVEEIAV